MLCELRKRSIVLITLLAFATTGISQDTKYDRAQSKQSEMKLPKDDHVMMQDGKVWLIKDGKSTLVTAEVTLGSTKIKPDGTVTMKDGKTAKLAEGDMIKSDGSLSKAAKADEPPKIK
jgi:hypothetical protein